MKKRARQTTYDLYDDILITTASSTVNFCFDSDTTAELDVGEYTFEIEVTYGSLGIVKTILQKRLIVKEDILV